MGLIRTWKESRPASGTYKLEKADVGTGQNMKRKQASKGHSLPEEGRHWDW